MESHKIHVPNHHRFHRFPLGDLIMFWIEALFSQHLSTDCAFCSFVWSLTSNLHPCLNLCRRERLQQFRSTGDRPTAVRGQPIFRKLKSRRIPSNRRRSYVCLNHLTEHLQSARLWLGQSGSKTASGIDGTTSRVSDMDIGWHPHKAEGICQASSSCAAEGQHIPMSPDSPHTSGTNEIHLMSWPPAAVLVDHHKAILFAMP